MYKSHFGLADTPFSIAPDPRYLYMSEQHREALAHLLYGVNGDGGFVLLTGEVGTGKTTVCRCLLEQLPKNCDVALILNPRLTVRELLSTICDELRIGYPKGNKSIKIFVDCINRRLLKAHAAGRKTVLIIDEAQNLSHEVLEQMRLLTNLETNQRKLLQIIMLGQPELRATLERPELRQLAQRIVARYHLGPLSKHETTAYVDHRLAVAGLRRSVFPASAMARLHHLSGGVPRLINVLADRAMLGAYVQGKESVDTATITAAAREAFGKYPVRNARDGRWGQWLTAFLLLALAAAVAVAAYYNHRLRKEPAGTSATAPQGKPPSSLPYRMPIPAPRPMDHTWASILPADQKVHVEIQSAVALPAKLEWPGELPIAESETMAYQALFEQWGARYQPGIQGTPCQQAEAQGLSCLFGQSGLDELRGINRPAVLKLFDTQDGTFLATLTALREHTATFVIGNAAKVVSLQDLALQWRGDYTVLWRPPPNYRGSIHIGYRGPLVPWLKAELARARGSADALREGDVFDALLLEEVKQFQLASGLKPDGAVGPQTLIRLNHEIDDTTPLLVEKTKE